MASRDSVAVASALHRRAPSDVARVARPPYLIQDCARGRRAPAQGFARPAQGIEQGVGIYVDQVYYSRIASATFDFTDTERIEILRGPQGTLYGKNTTAGAINITTKAPSFTPEGTAEFSYGSYNLVQARAAVSGPILGDTIAARLSAREQDELAAAVGLLKRLVAD